MTFETCARSISRFTGGMFLTYARPTVLLSHCIIGCALATFSSYSSVDARASQSPVFPPMFFPAQPIFTTGQLRTVLAQTGSLDCSCTLMFMILHPSGIRTALWSSSTLPPSVVTTAEWWRCSWVLSALPHPSLFSFLRAGGRGVSTATHHPPGLYARFVPWASV